MGTLELPDTIHRTSDQPCHDLETLEHVVAFIRNGHRLDTASWLRLLAEIQAVWPVSSKGQFRLWKVASFPSLTSER